jgi:hypothetical protein
VVNADQFLAELNGITEKYRQSLTHPYAVWRPVADLFIKIFMGLVGKDIEKREARQMMLYWLDMSEYIRNRIAEELGDE